MMQTLAGVMKMALPAAPPSPARRAAAPAPSAMPSLADEPVRLATPSVSEARPLAPKRRARLWIWIVLALIVAIAIAIGAWIAASSSEPQEAPQRTEEPLPRE